MKALLDSHAYLWWTAGGELLSPRARATIADPGATVFVSTASLWEISIKAALEKLPLGGSPLALVEQVTRDGLLHLPVMPEHAVRVYALPHFHRDPFDRLLVAQCLVEGLALVSADGKLGAYGVEVIW